MRFAVLETLGEGRAHETAKRLFRRDRGYSLPSRCPKPPPFPLAFGTGWGKIIVRVCVCLWDVGLWDVDLASRATLYVSGRTVYTVSRMPLERNE